MLSRTPSSHSSMLVVVKSSGAFVRRAPVREVAEWLFGLDWCAWVSNVLVGSAQHPLSPLFLRTPFTIQSRGEMFCK